MDYYKDKDWHKQLPHTRRRRSKKPLVTIALVLLLLLVGIIAYWWLFTGHKAASPSAETKQQTAKHDALSDIPLRDRVAGLFILHTPGTDPQALASYYQKYKPAGLIFMNDNVPPTPDELKAQTAALARTGDLPPLIAIDEEGDSVKRLQSDTFAGAWTLADLPPAATKEAFEGRSKLLHDYGFNLNFGIVADATDNQSSYIYERVLGTTPQTAADRVEQAVLGTKGLTFSTLKHFPGHGETVDNSHVNIPLIATSIEQWRAGPAQPFRAGIDAGADMVMMGHLRYTAVDSRPASLSKTWHDTLRNELKFKGLIVTDDMIMLLESGDAAYADPVANAVAALQAGSNILLYVLDHASETSRIDPSKLIDGVVAAVKAGDISESLINQRYQAVLDLRQYLAD